MAAYDWLKAVSYTHLDVYKRQDPIMAAEMVNRVLTDETLKDKILKNQRIRLQDFDNQKVKTQFLQIIDKIIQGK